MAQSDLFRDEADDTRQMLLAGGRDILTSGTVGETFTIIKTDGSAFDITVGPEGNITRIEMVVFPD